MVPSWKDIFIVQETSTLWSLGKLRYTVLSLFFTESLFFQLKHEIIRLQ
uniref:Uncharacterized protein n=1 Tax=Rhizophora mucronata TaxID=61149 RepID=A0A2P2MGN5_RHIMU